MGELKRDKKDAYGISTRERIGRPLDRADGKLKEKEISVQGGSGRWVEPRSDDLTGKTSRSRDCKQLEVRSSRGLEITWGT